MAGEREFLDLSYIIYQNLKAPETVTQSIDPDLAMEFGFIGMV
jgi:hypothetical protein